MRSKTITAVLSAPHDEVFAYLADIENLPRWATEFARELKQENGDYKVVNELGEFYFEIRADKGTGVIDMRAGATKDQLALFPTRTVELSGDQTAFTFTMFQTPGMPDELFASQYESLTREFENIKALFA
jgi:hypothetical protein